MTLVTQDNIISIIPQKPPFVMIDELLSCDDLQAVTSFEINTENVLGDNGELSEAGITENIAQTAAAKQGYITLQNNAPVIPGYIAAIKNLEIFALPKVGDVIETTVTITNQVFDVTIITGEVSCKDSLLAKCEMKIYLQVER